MKALSQSFQEHLDSGATSLCWCWRITRNDGVKFGFTDHDHNLQFDTTLFEASTGFSATDIDSSVGLNVDNLDVETILHSDRLNEDDLAAGLFDNAAIEIFRVNWQATSDRVLMMSGNLGEVSRGEYAFNAEIRGLAHELQQPKGRIYQYGCDADLGDGRCGVNLAQAGLTANATIASLVDQRTFIVTGLESFESDWFSRGVMTWTSGDNQNLKTEVKLHNVLDGNVSLELWQKMAHTVNIGDWFSIHAGCDKQFGTCQAKFSNVANFRGFPHIPGNDFAVSYPNSDDSQNDGGSLFS